MGIYLRNPPTMAVLLPPEATNHPIKNLLRSPRYATLYAILATIAATVSYTSFITGGGAGSRAIHLGIATFTLTTLLAVRIPLLLNAPALRNHPQVRTLYPNLNLSHAIFFGNMLISLFLTKIHLACCLAGDIYSVVSAAAHVVDVFFLLMCLLPGWRMKSLILPVAMVAVPLSMTRFDVGVVWFLVVGLVFALVLVLQRWLHSEAPLLLGFLINQADIING